ncbi:WD repeat-containing protein 61 [Multifurca ochricompacta]|uniref:WD repeat-containing protein 61 n=1 Tax=Multifurca ochricompacta TaxID=376703 RepID=A0AAD4QSB8_9AGAM|nr:WD repeat-containing protein 61 [Multifurca ochricompacta]
MFQRPLGIYRERDTTQHKTPPPRSLAYLRAIDCAEPHGDAVWGISWTAKDDSVISISADGTIKRWNSTSGQVMRTAPTHTLGLVSLSVAPDGRFALYNSVDGTTFLWDLEGGAIVGKHESYTRPGAEPSWSVSLNPKGRTYAATGGDFGEQRGILQSGRGKFGMRCSHSPDGSRVALSAESGQIVIFDLASSTLTSTYTSHAMAVRSLSWSPDSQLLLSASEDKRLILHDVRTTSPGRPGSGAVASLTGHSSWVLSSDISPDGRLALSGSADKTIKVWDLTARAAVSTIADTGEVWAVSWQPSSTAASSGAFVTGGEDGIVRWWKAAGTS